MNKKEIYANVNSAIQAILAETKITKKAEGEIQAVIDQYLKPKVSGTSNPPKLDDEGNIIEAWCRFHECYEVVEDMVMSAGKSKGYCKASISIWNRNNKRLKKLQADVTQFVEEGKLPEAQEASHKATELKCKLNLPTTFDYKLDWKAFNAGKPVETVQGA